MQWNVAKLREEMMYDGQEIPRNYHSFYLVSFNMMVKSRRI